MTAKVPTTGFKSYYERMIPKHRGKFARLPRALIDKALFRDLDGDSVKLLWKLSAKYFPCNNGDIRVYPKEYEQWGLSKHIYGKALAELKDKNLICQTSPPEYEQWQSFALPWLPLMNPLPAHLTTNGFISKYDLARFARLPVDVINTQKFASLSGDAVKLITYMVADWRESKGIRARKFTLNGYLQCSYELESTPKVEEQSFKKRGFSKPRLIKARKQLIDAGFIVRTYKHKPHRPKDRRTPAGRECQSSYGKGLTIIRQQVLPDLYAFTWGEYHIIPSEQAVLMKSLMFKAPPSEMLPDNPADFPIDAWMDGAEVKREQEPSTVE